MWILESRHNPFRENSDKKSVQSFDRLGRRVDMRDNSAQILFQSFLQEALVSISGMSGHVHSLMLSIQHFLCRPRQEEDVVTCDMPEPCRFPSLDSSQKRFLWSHKEVDLAPHAVVSLLLPVGDARKFLQALCFKSLNPFFFLESASSVHVSLTWTRVAVTRD